MGKRFLLMSLALGALCITAAGQDTRQAAGPMQEAAFGTPTWVETAPRADAEKLTLPKFGTPAGLLAIPAPDATERGPSRSRINTPPPHFITQSLPQTHTPFKQDKLDNPGERPCKDLETGTSPRENAERFWARAEYGLWSVRGSRLPPLITTSPAGTALQNAGVLGSPATSVLIGDERLNSGTSSGGQITMGGWLNPQQTCGIETSFWVVEGHQARMFAGSDGSQIIARPFTNALTGLQAAELISFPGLVAGSATVTARSDPLYGANALLRKALVDHCHWRLDLLAGYRFLGFDENLDIQESLTSLIPGTQGTNLLVTDRFATRNEFHGGELGLQAELWHGKLSLQVLGKLALGNTHRQVSIDGSTLVTVPGLPPFASPGGLAALSSNSGHYTSDRLTWIPELGITSGYQFTSHLRATFGYTFLWWPGLVRPGDQIDPVINPDLLPPALPSEPARPAFVLHDADLWLHGLRFGIELRY